jgi:hypothetical protein
VKEPKVVVLYADTSTFGSRADVELARTVPEIE